MKVVIDTSAWSVYLRRDSRSVTTSLYGVVERFVTRDQVHLLGIVRQELLSGVSNPQQFERLSRALSGFPDELATSDDHSAAAKFYNLCRATGVQGSSIDYLICAITNRLRAPILTLDHDFFRYARHLPIRVLTTP
jgi:predicted nucleic acid-binding protein